MMAHGNEPTNPTNSDLAQHGEGAPAATPEVDLVLPPTEASLDPLAQLEELWLELRIEDRLAARETTRLERERIQSASDARVEAIHDEADAVEWQGWMSGLGQVAGGALQAYGGFAVTSEANQRGFAGLGQFVGGVFNIGAVALGQDVADAQAAQVAAETQQGTAESRASDASNEMQNAREDLRALLDQIQRIHDAELAAQNAAVFLR
jgi:hypothetical protein